MNYWLLTTEYPPFYGGGISTYCNLTAQMLSREGNRVTVFVPDDTAEDYIVSEAVQGVTLIRFNSDRSKLIHAIGYAARLSYAFADIVRTVIQINGKPDIIEAQDYLGIAYYLTQFKQMGYEFIADVPIVLTLHSPAFIYLEYNKVPTYRFPDFWTCEMEKHSIIAADLLISPSRYLVEEIKKHIDLSGKEIEILSNPFKADSGVSEIPSFTPGKIVYYGKLSPQKGSFELLEYFRELWDNDFPSPLHIVGGTDIVFHPELMTMGQLIKKKYAAYLEKGLLQLHGKILPSQIEACLSDAQVVLVPSIVDNMPYVVMEAMSLGRVVLASVQGGQKEMIEDGVNGFLFDHDDPSSFGSQLRKIISIDSDKIHRVGENARRSVAKLYSPGTIGARKMAILQNLKVAGRQNKYFPFLYQEKPICGPDLEAPGELLSVIIPYYNMGLYLADCLESILQSTWREIEIIIINDGSTEPESIDVLNKVAGQLQQIRIIHQSNKGLAAVRNHGATIARGRYLAFLDADDRVDPEYYEKAIRVLQCKENVFFVGSWVRYFGNSDAIWPTFTPQPPYALVHNPINSAGLVYKTAAFIAGGLNDKKMVYGLEDFESVISMLAKGLNGVVLPEILFYYRVRTGSMIRNISREKLLYSNKYIAEKHSAYYAKFATQIINILNANGPGYLYDNPTFGIKVVVTPEKTNSFINWLKRYARRNERIKKILLTIKKINSGK